MVRSVVSCVAWVKRGAAKEVPEKVELDKEQLEKLIKEAKEQLDDAEAEDQDVGAENGGAVGGSNVDDELAEYDLDHYDDEPDMDGDGKNLVDSLAGLTMYADEEDDPYITIKDEDEEDIEDFKIKPSDNLILVGKAEEECSNLEIFVYNEADDILYCHHDIMLSAFPLALEWLNFDPGEEKPGNFVAVGNMTPVIEIWDLDLVDSVEPAFTLGEYQMKKKKKKSKEKVDSHKDAVLDLSWNRHARNVLASASADHTVALWDLSQGKTVSVLKQHTDKVQTLEWHPFEAQSLLTGAFDKNVKVFDCRKADQAHMNWSFNGEIERVLWNHFSPYNFLASTDKGYVYYMDVRQQQAIFTLSAHSEAVTGLALSSQIPGCLVTTSADKNIKVWDIQNNKPECVLSKDFKMGALTCVHCCPDEAAVMATGGEKEGLRVFDIMAYAAVSNHFGNRERVVVDMAANSTSSQASAVMEEDGAVAMEDVTMETEATNTEQSDSQVVGGTKKKKKKKKKKP